MVGAIVFANFGSAYGTSKSGVGIISVAVLKPELVFKSIIPAVMAGVLGLYGLIIGLLLQGKGKFFRKFNRWSVCHTSSNSHSQPLPVDNSHNVEDSPPSRQHSTTCC